MTDPTLPLLLARLARLNESFLQQRCALTGTTPAEVRVLAMLRNHEDGSPVSPTTIAQWVVQTSGGLTATLGRLESAGWVTREMDPDDRRARLVALTPAGRQFYDDVMADLLDRYQLVLAEVDPERALEVVRDLVDGFERVAGQTRSRGWIAGRTLENQ